MSGQSISTRRPQSHIDIYYQVFFFKDHIFLDAIGIRTNDKTLRLTVHTGTTTPGLYIPSGTTLLYHIARPAQISPALYSLAA